MLNKPRLLAPGPTPLPEEVRLAMARDMVHHRKPPFKKLLQGVQEKLQLLFGTQNTVMPLSCSGSGVMDAAIANCFNPGEKVLVVEAGKFGERWGEIAANHRLNIVFIRKEWGRSVTAAEVKEAMDANPDAAGLLVQASETSTGVLHPIKELGKLTKDRDMLLVADGISAVGISPCPMDAWGIDVLLTGSQKGLMTPPGLAFIALSDKAWAKSEKVTDKPFYFNLAGEREKAQGNQTLFTSPVSLLVGLEACFELVFPAEMTGVAALDAIYRKQWAMTMLARESVTAMGLELLAKDGFTLGLTSVKLPEGCDGNAVLQTANERYGIIFAGGQGHLKGRIVRIGHMGYVDWADVVAGLHALAASIRHCGGHVSGRNALETGLMAYERALEAWPANLPDTLTL